ncbi:hypothetical protein M2390_000832 [Mycetocola sp. BIGb0189]|uniref:hypothetical protein n=1 Tax=Mycetocola sp. BIGb0189 TaxID=2940604 RepID=UPI0021680BA2|nr:hypothetical protein [Mycetocola sp. BIGb0189]MCS4275671.1 hypothetical protein [Mycetocola sp. BIGb0189]
MRKTLATAALTAAALTALLAQPALAATTTALASAASASIAPSPATPAPAAPSSTAPSSAAPANMTASNRTVQLGASADLNVSFQDATTGYLSLSTPRGSRFIQTSDERCRISTGGTAITCAGPIRWLEPFIATITVDPEIPTGTVLTGGTARVAAPGGTVIDSATFAVTVGDTLATPKFEQQLNSIWGTGIPGATIAVLNAQGAPVAQTEVRGDGLWGIDIPFAGRGKHIFSLIQTLGTGGSAPTNVTVDFGEGLALTSPAHNGKLTGTPASFSGVGTVGATVTVAGTSRTICTTVVSDDGTWNCDAVFPLSPGKYTVTARQTGTAISTQTVTFTREPVASAADVKFTSPANAGVVTTRRPLFEGTGEPGSTVRVFGSVRTIGTAIVDSSGAWKIPPQFDLSGSLKLGVEQHPTNGAAASHDSVLFTVTP